MASTTVVSPRPTSFISGLTSCETDTCGKPTSRAIRATAVLVLRVAVGVHEHDRAGGYSRRVRGFKAAANGFEIGRRLDGPVRAHPLVHLEHVS